MGNTKKLLLLLLGTAQAHTVVTTTQVINPSGIYGKKRKIIKTRKIKKHDHDILINQNEAKDKNSKHNHVKSHSTTNHNTHNHKLASSDKITISKSVNSSDLAKINIAGIAAPLVIDATFKMNGFYVHRFDPIDHVSILNNDGEIDVNKVGQFKRANLPENFLAPFIDASLGFKMDGELARGSIKLNASLKHQQYDTGEEQFEPKISIKEAFFNIGEKNGFNIEIGLCEGVLESSFTDLKTFYRGPEKGIFGEAVKQMQDSNTKFTAIDRPKGLVKTYQAPVVMGDGNPLNDPNKVLPPHSRYFFNEGVHGDNCKEPRVNLYLPTFKTNKIEARVGASSTLTTNAQDGIFLSLAGYFDYNLSSSSKVRVSGGLGTSCKSKSSTKYCPPKGVTFGVGYLSRPFDVAWRTTYNHKSYVVDRSAVLLEIFPASQATGALVKDSQPIESYKNWSFDKGSATGPWTNSIKARLGLGGDNDLTLGLLHSYRTTGFKDSSGSNQNEHLFGASAGFNGPLGHVPFRWGVEVNYLQVNNKAQAMEYRFNRTNTPKMFLVGLGLNYTPIKHLKPGEHFDQFNKPFTHEDKAVSIE